MTRYDIARMCGYNSVEEYDEDEKRNNEIFFGGLEKQKPYVEKEPIKIQTVKHGKWLNHRAIWIDQPKIEGWFVQAKCSECEKWAHAMNPYTKSVDYKCCPHCGARMDGDEE